MEVTASIALPRRDAANAKSERHEPKQKGTNKAKSKEDVGWRKIVRNFMPS